MSKKRKIQEYDDCHEPRTAKEWEDQGYREMDDLLEDGMSSALDLYVEKKKEMALLSGQLERLQESALEEAFSRSGNSFRVGGCTIKKTVTGRAISWTADAEYVRLTRQVDEWKEKIKALEEPGILITCEGEEYHAVPMRPTGGRDAISVTIEPDPL